jgi:hypothetical protein
MAAALGMLASSVPVGIVQGLHESPVGIVHGLHESPVACPGLHKSGVLVVCPDVLPEGVKVPPGLINLQSKKLSSAFLLPSPSCA